MRHLTAALALALTLGAGSCAAPKPSSPRPDASAHTSSTTASGAGRPSTRAPRSTRPLERAVRGVAADHPEADVAVAFAPVGRTSKVRVVGSPSVLVAWSTIKVPLAVAVIRAGRGEGMADEIDRALTASDNEAAARLWQALGSGSMASDAVEFQLRRGGDRTTAVPAEVTVPGFSPFGQATWTLRDQTRFTAALPCLAGSSQVTDAMGRVVGGQGWGRGDGHAPPPRL